MSFPTCSLPNELFRARKYNGGILPGDGGGKTANSPITPLPWRRRRRRRRRHGWSSKYETTHNSSFPVKRRRQRRHLETREGRRRRRSSRLAIIGARTHSEKKRWIVEVEQNRSHDGVRIIISAKLLIDLDSLSYVQETCRSRRFCSGGSAWGNIEMYVFFSIEMRRRPETREAVLRSKSKKGIFSLICGVEYN